MTYTVTYGNLGDSDTEDVVITTTLPPSTTYVGWGWSSSDGELYEYPVGQLMAGETGQTAAFTVQYPDQQEISEPVFETPFTIFHQVNPDSDADLTNNTVDHRIGVPDLTITDLVVAPLPLETGVPVVFTATVRNQGTGWAWNPDNTGGFWVDVYLAPVPSYPYDRDSEKGIAAGCPPLAPGEEVEVRIAEVYPWVPDLRGPIVFTQEEIDSIDTFYARVDNYYSPDYGLVPEFNEMNNVGTLPLPVSSAPVKSSMAAATLALPSLSLVMPAVLPP